MSYSIDKGSVKNCATGNNNPIYPLLEEAVKKATAIDFNVSFLMTSGVELMIRALLQAADRGVPIRILCGNYLNITQPEALYRLKGALKDKLELRFYNEKGRSFHPKAYFFSYPDYQEVFVGSSNLSKSALTSGIEWNYRLNSRKNPEDYAFFRQTFEDLFENHGTLINDGVLRDYARNWVRPQLYRQLEEREAPAQEPEKGVAEAAAQFVVGQSEPADLIPFPQPRGAQLEALYLLKNFRMEGFDKGLVVAATGIGKTFLAAFDSKAFERILFVAHRDEILVQAQRSFECVQPKKSTGFFTGKTKTTDAAVIFASVATLGNKSYLNQAFFSADDFDYIIIDEFHHAVSGMYQNIIDYFKPRFLLGLTATPERLDNQDVFALCDYNTVYEVRLKEAINRGWLVPFRYYGIYDELDYQKVAVRKGRYDQGQLEVLASVNRRADLILAHYQKYRSRRALGFCISRSHALFMADYFLKEGIACCAVISGKTDSPLVCDRQRAIRKLKSGEIRVIFSVDMFNEGLDIPELDMVMFLRPTESPTVFLQQLGRGLRKSREKSYVNVLDFIGNYQKANLIPFFLTGGQSEKTRDRGGFQLPPEEDYPADCFVDFDFRLIDIFKKMEEDGKKITDRIRDEFFRIQTYCGHRPTRTDFYVYLDADIWRQIRSKKKHNPLKDYLAFLDKLGVTSPEEKRLINTSAHEFLEMAENTKMDKTYKMPVFLAFWNEGQMRMQVTEDDLAQSFMDFYKISSNRIDMLRDKSTKDVDSWGTDDYIRLAKKNPVRFLCRPENKFFHMEGEKMALSDRIAEYLNDPVFAGQFKDIIDYRTKRFYRERLEKLNERGGNPDA